MRVGCHATPPNPHQAKPSVGVRRVHVGLWRVGARWALFTPKTRPDKPSAGQRVRGSRLLSRPGQAAGDPRAVRRSAAHRGPEHGVRGVPERVAAAVTWHVTRSIFDRFNIVSEDDLRMAAQKTTMYVDTLLTTRVPG